MTFPTWLYWSLFALAVLLAFGLPPLCAWAERKEMEERTRLFASVPRRIR